jgi:type IV secretory pathway VirB6-like protein
VLSFTKYINELTITVDGETIFRVEKTEKLKSPTQTSLILEEPHPSKNNLTGMFHFNSFTHAEQIYKITHGPSLTLDYIDVEVSVNIEKEFHDQIRKTIRKGLPSTIHIKILFPSRDVSISLLNSYTTI